MKLAYMAPRGGLYTVFSGELLYTWTIVLSIVIWWLSMLCSAFIMIVLAMALQFSPVFAKDLGFFMNNIYPRRFARFTFDVSESNWYRITLSFPCDLISECSRLWNLFSVIGSSPTSLKPFLGYSTLTFGFCISSIKYPLFSSTLSVRKFWSGSYRQITEALGYTHVNSDCGWLTPSQGQC